MNDYLFPYTYSNYISLFFQDIPDVPFDWINAVQDFGVIAVICLLTVWGIWKYIVPYLITYLSNFEKERSERYSELVQEIRLYREALEVRVSFAEKKAEEDQNQFFQAYTRAIEAQMTLAGAMDKLVNVIDNLESEVAGLEFEVGRMRIVQRALFGRRIYKELGVNGDDEYEEHKEELDRLSYDLDDRPDKSKRNRSKE
jgi:hypothetical protein